jgi:Putative Flp pilus-assembly TadE/G-like
MRRNKKISGRKNEQGIILTLVAVFMLGVVGAMAALSIDVVTLYTARSEAQLAADGAALAGARVLANSGMTSNIADAALTSNAEALASAVAIQVAQSNQVGGRNLVASNGEVIVSFPNAASPAFGTNPQVTVKVKRTDLPTFFARIWGSKQLAVSASATAEAYNPSGAEALDLDPPPQIAPTCVKPWLLPNANPTGGGQIFTPSTGAIRPTATGLFGAGWNLLARCEDCSTGAGGILPAVAGQYYPGAIEADDFPVPTALPACSAGFNSYQLAVAGCVPRPIRCGPTAASAIDIDVNPYTTGRNADTFQAAKCLIHDTGAAGDSDTIDSAAIPSPPFQFHAGNQNPVAGAVGNDVLVSDSLVTIPVINTNAGATPGTTVTVIGFLQVFLNSTGTAMPGPQIPVTVVNMAGCGTGATGTPPILGNGASPVVVRLISPP